ncbi:MULTISPECIES: hypothetical protein [Acinetobacter]|uniref:hypothetical protein n=1 Tax=Acinetobacter TaxID=469 RepID=UPI00141BE848|nr:MULTISPECIES: hypothetical protein [Acinetobacter]MCS4296466.1 hypothetical protein [Acinetobacter guillouiae]MCW2250587.1 hypothetical protein [Acinetobacter sp. BIGb0204]NII37315.1 hypothetical protein [Acinetobacter sp. BIGb0196]
MKFKHFTILALIATSTSLVYAKPTQFYKPYKSVNTVENIQPKKYHIETVNVSLASKVDAPTFSTQDQIKERYVQKLTDELESKGLLADEQTAQPITLSFDIKQKRVFAGEDLKFLGSKAIGKYAHALPLFSSMTFISSALNSAE